ncbi:DUF899 family protein [Phytohabitans flavus]|uniref:DUF899 domain-containing protein n=1 Tax=Phytohabitans flavus TaxID=1076124 RepID=A0A6F8XJ25_9ACTN|nr:DUF899 domain-containing protein [Phytohabitans flavus]BCB73815.1 hypothetical protein Pflav_002250 [Phytohabitans flavus]
MTRPPIVSPAEWQAARDALMAKEKAATRALDALAAERRRLPMTRVEKEYTFEGPGGPAQLQDLFEGRRQLVVYHFMWLDDGYCRGCATFTDNVGHLAHLNARDTTFALVSRGPFADLEAHRQRMGWTIPMYSSAGTTFHTDHTGGEGFGLSVFLHDGDDIFRTYYTTSRGVDRLRFDFNVLDLTPYGRQEAWEDSPVGWPQTEPYTWWRLNDEYAT